MRYLISGTVNTPNGEYDFSSNDEVFDLNNAVECTTVDYPDYTSILLVIVPVKPE